MKKILSLLTLLLCIASGAWAASVNDLVAISNNYTFIADNITSNGTVKLTANELYDNNRIFTPTGNSVATNKGNSTIDGVQHLNSLRLKKTQDQLAFKVSAPCKVTFYTQSHSERGIQVGSTAGGTEYGSQPVSTTEWTVEITNAGVVYLSSFTGDFYFAGFKVEMAVVTSETLKSEKAVKKDNVALTSGDAKDGYMISGTNIVLGTAFTYIGTPTDIKLVKTVTYSDETTKDVDVDVTFDGTVQSGYYVGTATIGLTGSEVTYTVGAKQATEPTLALSASSANLTDLKSYEVGSTTVTLTGVNLTDGTYDAPVAEGITVSPTTFTVAEGAVNQEFTLTTSTAAAAKTVLTFECGTASVEFTLNYSRTAKRDVTSVDVTEATTWDWTKLTCDAVELKNDGTTDPSSSDEFLMAELPELTNSEDFNSQALTIVAQFPYRGSSNKFFQGNSIKFTTTVPGTVQVWFSNTGKRDESDDLKRFLYINETNTGVYSLNTTMVEASSKVAAGEVVINAYMGVEDPAPTMFRVNKIIFTPFDIATITTADYATFVPTKKVAVPDEVKAYYVNEIKNGKAQMKEVTVIPANTPVIIYKEVDTDTRVFFAPTDDDASKVEGNLLNYSDAETVADGTQYILAKEGEEVGFFRAAVESTIAARKAYLVSPVGANFLSFSFDGEATGIEKVENAAVNANGTMFNLAGQRVAQPTRVLYIVNGKKVVVK